MIDSGKYNMNQRQPAQANIKDVILFSRFLCGSYSDLIDSENSEVDFIMRYAKFAWPYWQCTKIRLFDDFAD
jgi:hypothetical protein